MPAPMRPPSWLYLHVVTALLPGFASCGLMTVFCSTFQVSHTRMDPSSLLVMPAKVRDMDQVNRAPPQPKCIGVTARIVLHQPIRYWYRTWKACSSSMKLQTVAQWCISLYTRIITIQKEKYIIHNMVVTTQQESATHTHHYDSRNLAKERPPHKQPLTILTMQQQKPIKHKTLNAHHAARKA